MNGPANLPWTRSCFVCGQDNPRGLGCRMRLEQDVVLLEYAVRPEDVGYRNVLHGGIASTLLDEVMTWAAFIALRGPAVAAEMTVRLKKPLRVGDRLEIRGWSEKAGRRLCRARGGIFLNGETAAEAWGTYVPMPKELLGDATKDFVTDESVVDLSRLGLKTGTPSTAEDAP